jgi:type I restriction enzyme M protein
MEFKEIWNLLDSKRGKLKYGEFHIILFLLILKKHGFSSSEIKENSKPSQTINSFLAESSTHIDIRMNQVAQYYGKMLDRAENVLWIKDLLDFDVIDSCFSTNEEFLSLFDSILSQILINSGKYSGEFILPTEISRFMLTLSEVSDKSKMYNPFAGAASFGISDIDYKYVGQEITRHTHAIALMRLIVSNSSQVKQVILGDSIANWNPTNDEFDIIITSPPFSMDLPKAITGKWGTINKVESFFIVNALETINSDGKIIMIVPEGYLSARGSTGNLRSHLLESDLVEAVVSLPSGVFINTSIKTSILVLSKAKKEAGYVKFISSDNFISGDGRLKILNDKAFFEAIQLHNKSSVKVISNEEIKKSGSYLNVSRYFLENIHGTKLSELLTNVTGRRISEGFEAKVINTKDIDSLILDISKLKIRKDYNKTFFRIIEESCLLIAPGSNFLKACWFEFTGEPILVKHNIKAFAVNTEKVDISYLANQFREEYLTKQMMAFSIGSIVPMINIRDILNLEIYLPSLLEQKDWLNKKFLKSLDSEKDKVAFIRNQFNEELGSKQHNIRQHLKNVKDSFDVLLQFMEKNNGILEKSAVINPLRGITVEKRMNNLYKSLQNVIFEVNNLTNEQNFSAVETLDLAKVVEETFEEHTTSNYDIELKVDELGLEELKISKFLIQFSKNDLKELLNNVIENSIKHGFREQIKQYKLLVYIGFEDDKIILQMVNNGMPYPKDVTKSFGIKGIKAGITGNKGIGVWKIIQAINHFEQQYEIIDEPANEFPAGWVFKFNRIN